VQVVTSAMLKIGLILVVPFLVKNLPCKSFHHCWFYNQTYLACRFLRFMARDSTCNNETEKNFRIKNNFQHILEKKIIAQKKKALHGMHISQLLILLFTQHSDPQNNSKTTKGPNLLRLWLTRLSVGVHFTLVTGTLASAEG
jgi:hypothetical protein